MVKTVSGLTILQVGTSFWWAGRRQSNGIRERIYEIESEFKIKDDFYAAHA